LRGGVRTTLMLSGGGAAVIAFAAEQGYSGAGVDLRLSELDSDVLDALRAAPFTGLGVMAHAGESHEQLARLNVDMFVKQRAPRSSRRARVL